MITVPIVVNYATSKSLERLNLAGNLFRTLGFGINMFPGMESTLKYLILQRCMIETIHPNTFDNLDKLEYLNLGKLSIKHKPLLQYRNNISKTIIERLISSESTEFRESSNKKALNPTPGPFVPKLHLLPVFRSLWLKRGKFFWYGQPEGPLNKRKFEGSEGQLFCKRQNSRGSRHQLLLLDRHSQRHLSPQHKVTEADMHPVLVPGGGAPWTVVTSHCFGVSRPVLLASQYFRSQVRHSVKH